MVQHFVKARLQQGKHIILCHVILPNYLSLKYCHLISGSDHGVKSQGDGWVLTVALIEGTNLASLDSSGFSDPYVVFTSNGKTRTSSVRLQTSDPQWNGKYFFFC
jgi:hypothetical protein